MKNGIVPVKGAGRTSDHDGVSDFRLPRVVGVGGAVLMGLGSILGTGIFVSIGIAAGVAGPSVLLAVALAAVVALFNGLSSAQLAASHPVSGGTYEYGYRYLNPPLGFTAGWMFLCAKTASGATAALGFAGYALNAVGLSGAASRIVLALIAVGVLTAIVASGMRRSSRANVLVVSLTLVALVGFVLVGIPAALAGARENILQYIAPIFDRPLVSFVDGFDNSGGDGVRNLLHATALMFVAYTGYGRIATLGEEIREPRRSIPIAIVATMFVTVALYASVTFIAIAAVGATRLADVTGSAAAPLEVVARSFGVPGIQWLTAAGAVTAMLGVLLNLLLGLSRVLLAMSRRGDMPRGLARLHGAHASPRRAVIVIGVIVGALALSGSIRLTWSFSAFTVLIYYALTNLAALRLPIESRLYPQWVPACGLVSCLGLAFWVESYIWLIGLAMIGAGLVWHAVARRVAARFA